MWLVGKYHRDLLRRATDASETHTCARTCNSPIRMHAPSTPLVQSSKEARKGRAQELGDGGEEGSGESTKIIFARKTP